MVFREFANEIASSAEKASSQLRKVKNVNGSLSKDLLSMPFEALRQAQRIQG